MIREWSHYEKWGLEKADTNLKYSSNKYFIWLAICLNLAVTESCLPLQQESPDGDRGWHLASSRPNKQAGEKVPNHQNKDDEHCCDDRSPQAGRRRLKACWTSPGHNHRTTSTCKGEARTDANKHVGAKRRGCTARTKATFLSTKENAELHTQPWVYKLACHS